ncbi:adenine deaminase C-terminal domain-containing protein [Sporofaciens musculi]|jgi:adenine deaminase|uniref:adenine deaminase C-terminal domain-containing protein n=1 Tax=Sporofaciens musculi TaxID=2681861 RepID=UPI0025A1E994|nr:adenine deaminase C-terminal domain-containing protein [Sporofaciens musculi]
METVSLLIKNAKVFNTYLKKFISGDVSVKDGRFYYIDREQNTPFHAEVVLDAQGKYMIPGLVDIHMHIESSMMTPEPFGNCVAAYGVTTIVSEPHEMANVKGTRGILEMISAAKNAPIDIFYGIPSSVPSTDERLETTGGIIDCNAMKHLLCEEDVVCVGEIMNYRQIIKENNLEITKFLKYLRQEHPGYVIEGHCPSLLNLELAKFLYLGIDGDHTEHTLEEVKQRIENGMFFEIQDKMLKPKVLEYICENQLYEYCGFVTDDTMADVLYEKGQLNYVVQQAIEVGFPLEMAIYCATYTPSRRMHLYDRGTIAPGKLADFVLLDSPSVMKPSYVYKNGVQIFNRKDRQEASISYQFPEDFYQSVRMKPVNLQDFRVMADTDKEEVTVRVIEVHPDRTQTTEKLVTMPVRDHMLDWEKSGCLLAMVLERHGKNGNIGYGFITGSCLKEGTVATTYFHDHHNLFVAGDRPMDMLLAVRRLQELQGGFLTVKDGRILAELKLPVCGILSEKGVRDTALGLKAIRESLEELGYRHDNPIMSLGTLGLPVSPALKLTDKGLVDVKRSAIVPLIVE